MNVWLIGYAVIVVLLVATVALRTTLKSRYPVVLNGLGALLIVGCLSQWWVEGATVWTFGLGAVALAAMIVAALKAHRAGVPEPS